MKLHAMLKKILSLTAAVVACSVCLSVPAFAAVGGDLIYIDGSQVKGWAWDSDAPDTPQQVKIYGYADGSDQPYHFGTVTADMYSDRAEAAVGEGQGRSDENEDDGIPQTVRPDGQNPCGE